jgi:preprotein translocase subunit SecG
MNICLYLRFERVSTNNILKRITEEKNLIFLINLILLILKKNTFKSNFNSKDKKMIQNIKIRTKKNS